MDFFISINIDKHLNQAIDSLVIAYGDALREVTSFILLYFLVPIDDFLLWMHPSVIIAFVALVFWHATKDWKSILLAVLLLYVIGSLGLWDKSMQTLSIMLVSILFTIIIGLPVGVFLAYYPSVSKIVRPVLDAMQTFPMFVYMLPVVMLFSIGKVPAVIATVIYSLPPIIRLTELGILQVDKEVKEAGRAFGASTRQILFWINLPLARPSILTGINQTTMMALAMVVICSMIGARGLGQDILRGINNLDFAKGFKAGVCIVILAFLIDRITQAYGKRIRGDGTTQLLIEEEN